MSKVSKIAYAPTGWLLLKFEYDDKAGRVYRVEQRTKLDGTVELRREIERN